MEWWEWCGYTYPPIFFKVTFWSRSSLPILPSPFAPCHCDFDSLLLKMNKHQRSFTAAKNGPSPTTADQIYKRRKTPTNILSLDPDIVCTIFALLDMFDLVRCSLVCKLWYLANFHSLFFIQSISIKLSSIRTCFTEIRACVFLKERHHRDPVAARVLWEEREEFVFWIYRKALEGDFRRDSYGAA